MGKHEDWKYDDASIAVPPKLYDRIMDLRAQIYDDAVDKVVQELLDRLSDACDDVDLEIQVFVDQVLREMIKEGKLKI